MYTNSHHNYSGSGSSPHALMKGIMSLTSGSPRSNIASGPSQGSHHFQVPIQPENVDLLMTAATTLTSLKRPQGYILGQGNREVLSALHGIPSDPMRQPPVHTLLKRKGPRQKAARFPIKLMQVLSSGRYDHIISWTLDGMSFVVRKPSLLVSVVLPLYFKEAKYTSFTRKLHRWGFEKILTGKELSAYYHKSFRRGDFELCSQMYCSKITPPIPKDGSSSILESTAASATKTDSSSNVPAIITNQPPMITHPVDRVGLSPSIETAGEAIPLHVRRREMQLIELQRLRQREEALSMPALHNNQQFHIFNHIIQAGATRQQFIIQRSQVPLAFENALGTTFVNTVHYYPHTQSRNPNS